MNILKANQTIVVLITAIILTACGTAKKKPAASAIPDHYPGFSTVFVTPTTGIYVPGDDELAAIRLQFHDATMSQLKEGYSVYTEGACIKCHNAQNIYNYTEIKWKTLIDDMATMAQITDVQKDAVYKYVLSVKAVQPPRALPPPTVK